MKLGELAVKIGAEITGDSSIEITGVGTLESATASQIAFLAGAKYKKYLAHTQAAAVILQEADRESCPVAALTCRDPKLALALALQLLYPNKTWPSQIHPSAVVGLQCEIDPSCYIGPHCVIGNRVKIGKGTILQAGCHIEDDVVIGAGTTLLPNVCIYHACKIGENCMLHSGVVIGSDGFGFAKHHDRWIKVPQVGGVIVGNRVEIGANTTIDRGAIEDTEIGDDVILDNLIHIAHNVKIGQGTAIAACSGIAGSTTIGKHCLIGGGSRINGHIQITDFVTIVGCTNVAQSITQAGAYASGISENNIRTWKKNLARFHQLDDLALRLIQLEKRLENS